MVGRPSKSERLQAKSWIDWLDEDDESSKARSWWAEVAAADQDALKAGSRIASILNIEDEDEVYEMLYGTFAKRTHLAKSLLV